MDDEKETKISQDKERNSRRRFLKIAGLAAGATAVAATVTTITPAPLRKAAEDSVLPVAAAAKAIKLTPYVDPLVIPPPATQVSGPDPAKDYYDISIVPGTGHQFHSVLPVTTLTQSYFATAPIAPGLGAQAFHYLGPTIVAQKGRPVVLKVTNHLSLGLHQIHNANPISPMDYTIMGSTDPTKVPRDTALARWTDEHRVCVHLHGGKVLTDHDGGPRDWFSPVNSPQANPYPEGTNIDPGLTGSHTYEYPNDQDAAMLWYHDHAWAITRFNPFLGQAGGYIVRDTGENTLITLGKIPNGAYEVPIVLQDRLLDLVTGAMIYPVTPTPGTHPLWIPEYFGNTPIINGRAYPFLSVEPRRYRFRFLNGAQARFFNMFLQGPSAGNLPIWVIGSEQGFLPAPAMVTNLLIAPGERFDTIIDFTGMKPGTTLTLKNNAKAPYPGGRGGEIPELMQFKVVPIVGTDTTVLPATLILPTIDPNLTAPATTLWREIVLQEIMDPLTGQPLEVLLDGKKFTEHAPPNPPLITEPNGAVNVWQFINTTGDAHPMHMHLVKYKVVDRQKFDVKRFLAAWDAWRILRIGARPSITPFLLGAPTLPTPEEAGWKDTAKAYPGEVLRIIAKFDLPTNAPTGVNYYVCHCHILEHEENDMMFYFGVNK
jgi:spore coat protein A, manganese oxidase